MASLTPQHRENNNGTEDGSERNCDLNPDVQFVEMDHILFAHLNFQGHSGRDTEGRFVEMVIILFGHWEDNKSIIGTVVLIGIVF